MRSALFLSLGLLLLLNSTIALAQKTILGRVTDSQSGKGISSAHVTITGQRAGTISNEEGNYQLELAAMPVKIRFSSIGYCSQEVEVTGDTPEKLDVQLVANPVVLDEIVVTGEDPAERIMREVIRRKRVWRSGLESYVAEGYTRLTSGVKNRIAAIAESGYEVTWQKERGLRTRVVSSRQTSNLKPFLNVSGDVGFPNFYDDYFNIFQQKIVGVTHPQAFDSYTFTLKDRRTIDNQTVFIISFFPRNASNRLPSGEISVLDEEFAMVEIRLRSNGKISIPASRGEAELMRKALMPAPGHEGDFDLEQSFSSFGSSFWLPVNIRARFSVSFQLFGAAPPPMQLEQVTRLTNYRVNVPVDMQADERGNGAGAADSSSVHAGAFIPLTKAQESAWSRIDSTEVRRKARAPKGLFGRYLQRTFERQFEKRMLLMKSVDFFDWYVFPHWSFNRVDGHSPGIRAKLSYGQRYSYSLLSSYKTAQERWSYDTGFVWSWGKQFRGTLEIRAQEGTVPLFVSRTYSGFANSILTFLGHKDYFDYYWNSMQSVRFGYRFQKERIEISTTVKRESHHSLQKTAGETIRGKNSHQRDNPPIDAGRLGTMEYTVAYGDTASPYIMGNQRRIELTMERSIPGLISGDFTFARYQAALGWRFEPLFRNSFAPHTLDIRLIGMTSEGNLPVQRFGIIDTGRGSLSPFGSFRSIRSGQLAGEKYCAVFWEYNAKSLPFRMIGLNWAARRGMELILQGASGRTWISESRISGLPFTPNYMDSFHHEIGFSVNNIIKGYRVDVTRNIRENETTWGFGYKRPF